MVAIVSFNHFPQVGAYWHKQIARVVEETANDIQAVAAIQAPVDTGFLRDSIYTVTTKKSGYGQAGHMTATGRRKKVSLDRTALLPEVEKSPDDWTAYVAVGAPYGIYLEMGTRFMPAQPYFYSAVEFMRSIFDERVGQVLSTYQSLQAMNETSNTP